MYYYAVKFEGTPHKEYFYRSKERLPLGAICEITADETTTYNNHVKIKREVSYKELILAGYCPTAELRLITSYKIISGYKRPNDRIKQVYFNKEKKTTVVIWDDGKKTMVKCQPQDEWDEEKALALCYMKRILGNRGSFNETLRKWTT